MPNEKPLREWTGRELSTLTPETRRKAEQEYAAFKNENQCEECGTRLPGAEERVAHLRVVHGVDA